jgi:hypothetical protein
MLVPALLASLLVASPAQAQFGGLIKKAKEAATEKAVDKAVDKATGGESSPGAPRAGGEALTATTLSQVLAGARAADGVLAKREQLVAQRKADEAALRQLESQNQGTRNAYEQANRTVLACREVSISDSEHKRETALEAKMKSDPQNIARMQMIATKYGAAMAQAQQRGDTAAYAKAMREMQAEVLGVDIYTAAKGDTAAADAKCGKVPAKPAALTAQEQKEAAVRKADDDIRTLEAQAVTAGAQASGLDRVRYLELKERVATILGVIGGRRGPVSYSGDEVDLVRAHKSEIDQFRRAF